MTTAEVIEKLGLEVKSAVESLDGAIEGCYVSDLLSNVMGQTGEGVLWVTMQGHPNIVAIASLLALSGIVVAGGAAIEQETINKAAENDVLILATEKSSFEVAGLLYQMGLRNAVK